MWLCWCYICRRTNHSMLCESIFKMIISTEQILLLSILIAIASHWHSSSDWAGYFYENDELYLLSVRENHAPIILFADSSAKSQCVLFDFRNKTRWIHFVLHNHYSRWRENNNCIRVSECHLCVIFELLFNLIFPRCFVIRMITFLFSRKTSRNRVNLINWFTLRICFYVCIRVHVIFTEQADQSVSFMSSNSSKPSLKQKSFVINNSQIRLTDVKNVCREIRIHFFRKNLFKCSIVFFFFAFARE